MEELQQLKESLLKERPVPWNEFPDIALYMDQVISYMDRQLIKFNNEGQLTSAMVNNYIKDKLLPRADGKKYNREHLAGLTEICLLKQVLPVRDTGLLLSQENYTGDPEGFYMKLRSILDDALNKTAECIDPDWSAEDLSDMALKLAVTCYCEKLACERLLDIIRIKLKPEEQDKPAKKVEKKEDKKTEKKTEKQADKQAEQ